MKNCSYNWAVKLWWCILLVEKHTLSVCNELFITAANTWIFRILSKVRFATNKSPALCFTKLLKKYYSSQMFTELWWCTSLLQRQNWKTHKTHNFTSIYQGLGVQIQQKSTQQPKHCTHMTTLQGTNISRLGTRNIIDSKVQTGRGVC